VLLWLGEGAFDPRHQRTLRALVRLLRAAQVDFAVLGEEEADCGDLARRLGDEATFADLARRNVETLARYRFEMIVTADPHARHVLAEEYTTFGASYVVLHHTTYLARLVADGRLRCNPRCTSHITTPAILVGTPASTMRPVLYSARSGLSRQKWHVVGAQRVAAAGAAAPHWPTSRDDAVSPTTAWTTYVQPGPRALPSRAPTAPPCSKASPALTLR
jgi:hypothetical protein